jgi:hypothetical protein
VNSALRGFAYWPAMRPIITALFGLDDYMTVLHWVKNFTLSLLLEKLCT